MKRKLSVLCLIAAAGIFAAPAEAIYKCTTAKGTVYQDQPCREGTQSDVQIVIPTGEIAPKGASSADEAAQASGGRPESYFGQRKAGRAASEDSPSIKPAGRSADKESTSGGTDAKTRNERSSYDTRPPMTMEQAQRTEPSAKYYTTDTSAAGVDTPEQMTCESPSGEKRRFILTNGKMTSI